MAPPTNVVSSPSSIRCLRAQIVGNGALVYQNGSRILMVWGSDATKMDVRLGEADTIGRPIIERSVIDVLNRARGEVVWRLYDDVVLCRRPDEGLLTGWRSCRIRVTVVEMADLREAAPVDDDTVRELGRALVAGRAALGRRLLVCGGNGVSRAPALAYAILAEWLDNPVRSLQLLEAQLWTMRPNRIIVGLADDIGEWAGDLTNALLKGGGPG